jgi:predicted TIM-barrel fold metal-dependent hydrolase
MARVRENVFLDLSHTLHYLKGSSAEKDIGFVARRLDRRVLFGSDFPESSIAEALAQLHWYLREWPEADLPAITGGNWFQILRNQLVDSSHCDNG